VEGDEHLLSSEALVHLLIDIVSKNGNLLLDVGPAADGSIPDNQLKRLNDLGDWLAINGEGIFGTKPWWMTSSKLKDGSEVRFTQKNEDLYIFLMSSPKGKTILIPSCKTSQSSKVLLYGTKIELLPFSSVGDGIEIKLPGNMNFKFAKMIKITR